MKVKNKHNQQVHDTYEPNCKLCPSVVYIQSSHKFTTLTFREISRRDIFTNYVKIQPHLSNSVHL